MKPKLMFRKHTLYGSLIYSINQDIEKLNFIFSFQNRLVSLVRFRLERKWGVAQMRPFKSMDKL